MNIQAMDKDNQLDVLETWRANVFVTVARVIAYAATFMYFLLIGFLLENLNSVFFVAYTGAYLLVLAAAFASRIPVIYRAYSVVILVYLLGIASSVEKAAIGDGRVWFVIASIFAAVFLGRRAGIAFTVLGAIAWGVIGILFAQEILTEPGFEQLTLEIWGGTTVTLLGASLATVISIGALLVNLNKTIDEGFRLARTAEEQSKELENQRNALELRSHALELSAKISRKAASLTSSDDILLQAPIMIKNNFDLLSAAFFKLEEDNRLYLRSSDGWNEQAYPKHDYVVALEDDITGEAVIRDEALCNKNSGKGLRASLPEARSFASIPMHGRSSNITGVLLLQSAEFGSLDLERLAIMQMLADQIAVLMDNTDLLVARESALEAERRAYGDITESAWMDFMQDQTYSGYLRDKNGLRSISEQPYVPPEQNDNTFYQVPIMLRGRKIGHIDAQKTQKRSWTISERELLNTLAGRLENALDSARLYEEIQERATRERLVSEASSRMRESLDVQTVLKAAVEELHKALGDVAETEIWIAPEGLSEDRPATE